MLFGEAWRACTWSAESDTDADPREENCVWGVSAHGRRTLEVVLVVRWCMLGAGGVCGSMARG